MSKADVDAQNKLGAEYDIGCDWSSIWGTDREQCFCDEDKCNGAGINAGSLALALVLALGAMFLAKE